MREKLIELIGTTEYGNGSLIGNNFQKGFIKKIADHLIANGVTNQKWIPVTERLPEKDGHYLCNYHFGEYPKMTFTQVLDYYATDIVPHFQHTLGDGSMKVTHWMEIPQLPEPPKGE